VKLVSGIVLGLFVLSDVFGANTPCSRSMGGVANCTEDGRFLCNNGKFSSSKKICSGYAILKEDKSDEPTYTETKYSNEYEDTTENTFSTNKYNDNPVDVTMQVTVGINYISDDFLDIEENKKNVELKKLENKYFGYPNIKVGNCRIYQVQNIKLLRDSFNIAIYGDNGDFYFSKEDLKNSTRENFNYILEAKLQSLLLSENDFEIWKQNNNQLNYDQLIDKETYKVYYNNDMKGALFVTYTLNGSLVNKNNIKKRPRFYSEKNIPTKYRSKSSDYKGSGYDRGHLANDASFDHDIKALRKTYSMANIIPQSPAVNRRTWIKTEKLERKIAYSLGNVNVIIGVKYLDNPKRIGKNKIAVPTAFYKKIFNKDKKYEKCFYYNNSLYISSNGDKLKNHLVDCNILEWL